ncbi:MurR/RpiR family transcriptional regulator [Erysipelotrichaceae bacterium RD49]|nr:MurR/RpiR family transcriptional regulator [Erysipelotrichaceae bacterium RD49]
MIIELLEERKNFSAVDCQIADYVLHHPEELASLSAWRLTDASYTSKASIFRFLRKLGVSGFPEFKSRLIRELDQLKRLDLLLGEMPFSAETTVAQTLEVLPAFFESVIRHSAMMQNVHQIKKAGAILHSASFIDIYCLGIIQAAGLAAQYKFQSIGRACAVHTGINDHYMLGTKDANHAALLLSFTGNNPQIAKIAQLLKELKIPSVGIMGSGKQASSFCTVCLPLYEDQNVAAMEFMDPLYSMLFIIDLLFVYLHMRSYEADTQAAKTLRDDWTLY